MSYLRCTAGNTMSLLIDKLAEQHIQEAIKEGLLDDLAGKGEPIELEDETFIPDTLRMGYHLLKNAGFLPVELEQRKDALALCDLIGSLNEGSPEAADAVHKLKQLELKMRIKGADTRFVHRYLRNLSQHQ